MSISWQQQLSNNIKSVDELIEKTANHNLQDLFSEAAHQQFKIKIPLNFISRDGCADTDPLLKQVLPHADETILTAGYLTDPVGDIAAMSTPGLIHKYKNRALFIVTGACAIHCRYCFRRHFPYSDSQVNKENWQPAFDYLREHTEISEIILSGGDPLMISDEKLQQLVQQLEKIPHIKRLRIHSRIPSVLPERINDNVISVLQTSRFQISLVTHINHPDELSPLNRAVFQHLKQAGVLLLNQSVLLFEINDSDKILVELSEKLYEYGILPYYLHLLDPVQGAAHFSVKEADAIAIMNSISKLLPGYLTPNLVKEVSGEQAKIRIV
ncbi:MAG: EF-P beta-lysylation protein EpmB [Gammaproteobacteria bacterium]|nr:EF-P beta-lysylation protein EpmB [Gammaproteobacteria bacterium]